MGNKLLVIGAGAAGLTAAGFAASRGINVTLLERNEKPARKVMITGKGRCNVTNDCDLNGFIANVPTNGRFLYSAFSRFSSQDVMQWIESLGVPLKTERGNRVFPCSDKSVDIVDALVRFNKKNHVNITHTRVQKLIIEDGRVKGVIAENGEEFTADAVIVATGGKSYPVTGSTGDGYMLAEQAGHTVTPLRPSLVPLVTHEGWCTKLQGLSLKNVSVTVTDTAKGKEVFNDFGEMLFTHFGVSGPLILSASAHMRGMEPGKYRLSIDLKPALTFEQLDQRILRDFSENSNKDFQNSLKALLPMKLIPVIVQLSGIDKDKKVNSVSREERHELVKLLKCLSCTIRSFRPVEEAIVTAGGVKIGEVNPKTMQSKLIDGLYFCGEVLDVDAYTGGFNLQIAFSTGYSAGMSALNTEE